MFVILGTWDWGLIENAKLGSCYYRRGEVIQVHLLLYGEHVWIERHRAIYGTFYRVAFGEHPGIPPQITLDELRETIRLYFLGLVEVVE